jgi:hypothetical protein
MGVSDRYIGPEKSDFRRGKELVPGLRTSLQITYCKPCHSPIDQSLIIPVSQPALTSEKFSVSYCYTSNILRYSWTLHNSPKPSHRRAPCDYVSAVLQMIATSSMLLLCDLFRPNSVPRGRKLLVDKAKQPRLPLYELPPCQRRPEGPSNGSERLRVAHFATAF